MDTSKCELENGVGQFIGERLSFEDDRRLQEIDDVCLALKNDRNWDKNKSGANNNSS